MFIASGALQYNDPDPLPWILVYCAAAAACLIGRPRLLSLGIASLVGAVSLLWAVVLLPRTIPGFRFGDLFLAMKAETPAIEWGREVLGLLIVAAWMTVLLLQRRKTQAESGRNRRPVT